MAKRRKPKAPVPTLRTISGEIFTDLKNPRPAQIHIEDIAHGLSFVCRFSGQIPVFYSVAAHSILVSEWIERNGGTPEESLWGLLHDASEAYITDLPSPVKRLCPDYRDIEIGFMEAISDRFDLCWTYNSKTRKLELPAIVKKADSAILAQEKLCLFPYGPWKMLWAKKNCKKAFLKRFDELTKKGSYGCQEKRSTEAAA